MRRPDRLDPRRPTRRQFLALGLGAFVVAAAPLGAAGGRRLVRRSVPVMGTVADFLVVHPDPVAAQEAIDAAIGELRRVEALMTRFAEGSDVGRANRLAAAGPVPVDPETATVIGEALAWAEASDGAFDPCLGRAVRLWDVGRRTTPPAASEFGPLGGRRLYRALDVGRWRGTPVVRFARPEVELDLGGIAKGHGVDRAVEALRRRGIRQAVVNVGGDLSALGESERGEPWHVGVRAPEDPGRLAGSLAIRDAAIATSGDYLQYFEHRGRRYHHLLDPATGAPRETPVSSVTIRADTCLAADAAATAAFVMPRDRVERLLRQRAPGTALISAIERARG